MKEYLASGVNCCFFVHCPNRFNNRIDQCCSNYGKYTCVYASLSNWNIRRVVHCELETFFCLHQLFEDHVHIPH